MPGARHRAFTLIEVLTVIAIIIMVFALAVPNFVAMLQSQRWAAASGALHNALMRCRSYALNERQDHSVEICVDTDNASQYLRIEVESAALESIPNLNVYWSDIDFWPGLLPVGWERTFMDAGGAIVNKWPNRWTKWPHAEFRYDGPKYDVSSPWDPKTKDNLKVDDQIRLPHAIKVDFDASQHLMNYDKPPKDLSDMPQYGWDCTPDLRFNMAGVLVQAQNPEIVLVNKAGEQRRLQVLRSTGRVRRLEGIE